MVTLVNHFVSKVTSKVFITISKVKGVEKNAIFNTFEVRLAIVCFEGILLVELVGCHERLEAEFLRMNFCRQLFDESRFVFTDEFRLDIIAVSYTHLDVYKRQDLVSTSLYYANKVKDGKGVLDTDTYIVVWTTTPFTVTASRGLTVGADIEYVLVKPAGENRKFVVASELLNSLSEKFGWTDVEVLQSYRGEELNQIVTEHPWDTEVDELVILGDHVTTDSGTGIVHTAPGRKNMRPVGSPPLP